MNSNLMRKMKKTKGGHTQPPPVQELPQQPPMFGRLDGFDQPQQQMAPYETYNATQNTPSNPRYPPGILLNPPTPQLANVEETMADPKDPFWMRRRYTREDSFPELADLDLSAGPEIQQHQSRPQPPPMQMPPQRMPPVQQKKDAPPYPQATRNSPLQQPPLASVPVFASPANFRPPPMPQNSERSMNTAQTATQELWHPTNSAEAQPHQSSRGHSHSHKGAKRVKVKKQQQNTPTFNTQPMPPAPTPINMNTSLPRPPVSSQGWKPTPNPHMQQRQPGTGNASSSDLNVLMSKTFADTKNSRFNSNDNSFNSNAPAPLPPPKVKASNPQQQPQNFSSNPNFF